MSNIKKNQIKKAMDRDFERDFRSIRDGSRKELSTVCQDYLKALVDTRSAPKVGIPTLVGGFPGRTKIEKFTQQLEIVTGTGGLGFIKVITSSLYDGAGLQVGPFVNSSNFVYSDGTFAGTTIPVGGSVLAAGVNLQGWTQSKYNAGTISQNGLQWRVVGCTMKVFPESSFADQNGRIALIEQPGHEDPDNAFNFTTLESYPGVRVVRGVQTGSQAEKIVLNYHPQSMFTRNYQHSDVNDMCFQCTEPFSAGLNCPYDSALVLAVKAAPATTFHVEVTAMYELRGSMIMGGKPRMVDSRGMDLIVNTLSRKLVSGYVGKPEHIYESYLSQIWRSAKKIGTDYITKNEDKLMNGAVKTLGTIAGFI